ncbi:MAG TPA: AraC family transcriptional regulator [Steroidobacteraceae bacterium]|jgi:AraC-like DNA-binding protein|nr:AraC family transcriptional regulator [Steroidobacteraceae bacterium]
MNNLADLRELIERHAESESARRMLPGAIIVASRVPTEPLGFVVEPAFALAVQGTKRAVINDKVFEYGAGQFLILSVDLPLTTHVVHASPNKPFLGFGLILKPAAIASLLLETGRSDKTEARGIAVSGLTADLIDPVVRLLRLVDRPDDVPVLGPAIEREILWRLINSDQGATVRQIGLVGSRISQVARAIRWIRTRYAEILRIEDLAQLAGMSVTSFHRHFRAVTSMTPIQYQKQIRLQEARARLLANPKDVAAVGFAVGYDSPSQFSREYRRQFGAPPGKHAAANK